MIQTIRSTPVAFLNGCASRFEAPAPVLLGLLAALLTVPCAAQTTTSVPKNSSAQSTVIANLLDQLGRTRKPRQAAISPDGRMVAWIAPEGNTGDRVHLRTLAGTPDSTQVISASATNVQAGHTCSERDVVWSPDGRRVAFTSDCSTPGQQQIFLADVSTTPALHAAAPRQLTALKGFVHDLA